ncbi:hypothetical protein, partial [Pseudomonas nitroreducens]|uniref:hypothetical protein n=2 Tax=Pseudomonas TaxID=286 RepID=UPI000474AC60
LKDEHKGEELYVSTNSVTKVGETLGIPQAMARRDLANGSAEERSAAARKLFQYQLKDDANSEAGQVVADALAEVAKRDPKGAEKILQILDSQQKLDLLVQNASSGGSGVGGRPCVTGVLLTVAGILASQGKQQSGDASGGDGLDPTTGVPTWTSGSSDSSTTNLATLAAALAIYKIMNGGVVSGLYDNPLVQQDNLPLTTPAEDPTLWKPGSGGYGADGKVDTSVSTGGSDIHENNGSINISPAEQVPSLACIQ